jgi:hypothetical protein
MGINEWAVPNLSNGREWLDTKHGFISILYYYIAGTITEVESHCLLVLPSRFFVEVVTGMPNLTDGIYCVM